MQSYRYNDPQVPQQLRLFHSMCLARSEQPDLRLTFSPSALPIGAVSCSALDGAGTLWYKNPADGRLLSCLLTGGAAREWGEQIENRSPDALHVQDARLWVLAGETVYAIPVPPVKDIVPLGKQPLQKIPRYYLKDDARVSGTVKQKLEASRRMTGDSLLEAIGGVVAVCADGAGGRFVALRQGVMHCSAETRFDRRAVELYHGGRYVFGADSSVCGVAYLEDTLWIENAQGYVSVTHSPMSLSEKERHYDRLSWELHSVRGSLCDTHYRTEDFGNGGVYEQTQRYSTNNDALWSVFHSIGDALKYSCLKRRGDCAGAGQVREKLIRVTKNVLLQSHIHGLGNGFVARGYVSKKDGVFIKDGKLDTNGLWYEKDGVMPDGTPCVVCADTPVAHIDTDPVEGRCFVLTPEVKARLGTDARTPVDGDFRLSAPICAAVPASLAALYREADPYRPEKYPASEDSDIIFKADTSSEEAIAAFVQYYFVWKHLLQGSDGEEEAALRDLIADTAAATMTHLLDNGYCLRDLHGNPTQWGKWFADYFVRWEDINAPWRHPVYAFSDGPLNGAEMLCMLKVTAYLLEGNETHAALRKRVLAEYEKGFTLPFDGKTNGAGYASLLGMYRENLAYTCRATAELDDYSLCINYSDETLAIIAFWPLLELEEDAQRRAILANGLDEWWHNMRREGNPIYSFAYAALNPDKQVDFSGAVDYLNRLPLYPSQMPVENSARNDLVMLPGKEHLQANRLLPIDERRMHKFNTSPFRVDAQGPGGKALYEEGYLFSGSLFTWPYWTAQYYNLLDFGQ